MSRGVVIRMAALPLIIIGGVLVLLILAIAVSAAAMPGCAGCHLEGDFASATAASSHADLACADCHGGTTVGARLEFGASQVLGMYLSVVDVDGALAAVHPSKCLACHESDIEEITDSAGIRILHDACAPDADCSTCHASTAHGTAVTWPRSVSMEMCFECHGAESVPDECDVCHSSRLPRDRIQTGSFQITHGPDYLTTHGMGDMHTCTPCHEQSKCEGCHGAGVPHAPDFLRRHGESALASSARCLDCHLQVFCDDCHQIQMPHTLEFGLTHGETVTEQGDDMCVRCHDDQDCVQCHLDHVHPVTLEQLESMGFERPEGD